MGRSGTEWGTIVKFAPREARSVANNQAQPSQMGPSGNLWDETGKFSSHQSQGRDPFRLAWTNSAWTFMTGSSCHRGPIRKLAKGQNLPHEHNGWYNHWQQVKEWHDRLQTIPLGRAGTPGEIANVIAWLCSKDAESTVGQCLEMDGDPAT